MCVSGKSDSFTCEGLCMSVCVWGGKGGGGFVHDPHGSIPHC